jgi:hypothetical protein
MNIVPIHIKLLPIAEKDNKLVQIEKLIEAKKNMLLKKQKTLTQISNQNSFLSDVKNDYVKYNNYIVKQKEHQIISFKIINDYINNLIVSGKLSKYDIEDAKEEQKKILTEIKSIRRNLDDVINDTNNLTDILTNKH